MRGQWMRIVYRRAFHPPEEKRIVGAILQGILHRVPNSQSCNTRNYLMDQGRALLDKQLATYNGIALQTSTALQHHRDLDMQWITTTGALLTIKHNVLWVKSPP